MRGAERVAHIRESIEIVNEKYEGKRSLGRCNCRRLDNKKILKWE